MHIDVQELMTLLAAGPTNVSFYKLNGDVRDMRCTTNLAHIPTEFHPVGDHSNTKVGYIVAFDLEAGGWRTFLTTNVFAYNKAN